MLTKNNFDMTPDQIIAKDPMSHPDFICCTSDAYVNHKFGSVYVPNLVALLKRFGGPDNVPGRYSFFGAVSEDDIGIVARNQFNDDVVLRDRDTNRVYIAASRLGDKANNVALTMFHPANEYLEIIFNLPTDWTSGLWEIGLVCEFEVFSTSSELDRLIVRYCDNRIGWILANEKTYGHIRRDTFIP